jgi:transposase
MLPPVQGVVAPNHRNVLKSQPAPLANKHFGYKPFQKPPVLTTLAFMGTTELTDEQWQRLQPLLPPHRERRGRPRADDRKTLNGILYVLRTGCRWQDVPRKYGSPTTCWRRLRAWEQDGTWENIWRSMLALLDKHERLEWSRAFLDGSFVPAKKGEQRLAKPSAAKAPRRCWSLTVTAYPSA